MFISKKKYNEIINRIEQLERKIEQVEEKSTTYTFEFGDTNLKTLCRQLPKFVDKRIAAALDNRIKKLANLILGS